MPVKIGSPDFGKTTLLRMQKSLGLGYNEVMRPARHPTNSDELIIAQRVAFYRAQHIRHMEDRARWSAAIARTVFGLYIDELTRK
jgi:hypothetical protein